jgi:hypothetical protein
VAVYLHAAHQVRETLDGLAILSWLVIGLATGALVLSWGRLVAWLRSPDRDEPPRLIAWGEDAAGWHFDLANAAAFSWSVEDASSATTALSRHGRTWRCGPLGAVPVALLSSGGARLPLLAETQNRPFVPE